MEAPRGDKGAGKRDRYDSSDHDRSKRSRAEHPTPAEDPNDRVDSLIIRLGDKVATSLEANIDQLAGVLEGDIPKQKEHIARIILKCASSLPTKTPIYATLVGLLNVKTFDFGAELVSQLHARLQEALDTADAPRVRLLVRFVGELVNANVLPPASLVSLLDRLLEAALDAHAQPADSAVAVAAYARGDMLAHAVVGALPFVGRELHERRPKDLQRLVSLLDAYVARRPPLEPRHAPALAPATDALLQQWRLVGSARDAHFVIAALPRPFRAFEGRLNLALQHTLAPADVPPLAAALQYPRAPPSMPLFPDAGLKPLDRVLVDMYVADLLHFFHQSHRECAKQLSSLPLPADVPSERAVLEGVTAHLLHLPAPEFKLVYYADLLTSLSRLPNFTPHFNQLMDILVLEKLPQMDMECFDRLSEFFAHHLSNCDYKWNWSAWDSVLSGAAEAHSHVWLQDVLEKIVRLSYWDRIRKTLPDEFVALMPPKVAPVLKYSAEREGSAEAKQLEGRMREKTAADAVLLLVRDEWGAKLADEEKLDIVMHCVLSLGAKSFSHLLNTVERYLPLLRALITSAASRLAALRAVHDFWQNSPQHLLIIADKLMTYRIVDHFSIVAFLFSPELHPALRKAWPWEMLRKTLGKTEARLHTLRAELRTAEKGRHEDEEKDGERVRQLRAGVDAASREFRDVFALVVQRVAGLLAGGGAVSGTGSVWHHRVSGQLHELARKYAAEVEPHAAAVDELIRGQQNFEPAVLQLLQDAKLLRA